MKKCEVCGSTTGVKGKNGKFHKDLCTKHYLQMQVHGKIRDRTGRDKNEIIIYDDYAEIVLYNNKNIEIGRVKIDRNDVPVIENTRITFGKQDIRAGNRGLAYVLMDVPSGYGVSFVDKDIFNHRKNNLMLATVSQRAMHKKKATNNKSGTKGVCWASQDQVWKAYIGKNGRTINLGGFKSKEDAIRARKAAEELYFGEFAYDPNKDATLKK